MRYIVRAVVQERVAQTTDSHAAITLSVALWNIYRITSSCLGSRQHSADHSLDRLRWHLTRATSGTSATWPTLLSRTLVLHLVTAAGP